MKLTVNNVGPIDQAVIKMNGITLVVGVNGAGKSSILMAAALLASGKGVPDWVNKKDSNMLVRTGQQTGGAALEFNGLGSLEVSWPRNTFKGALPSGMATVSPVVAGMVKWMDMTVAERRIALSAALRVIRVNIEPTWDDFVAEFKKHRISLQEWWDVITRRGWDGANKAAQEEAVVKKALWRRATGEEYGEVKAGTWKPSGWREDLAQSSRADLLKAVDAAKAARDDGIRRQAVSGDRLRVLREEAAKTPIDIDAIIAEGTVLKDKIGDQERMEADDKAGLMEELEKIRLVCVRAQGMVDAERAKMLPPPDPDVLAPIPEDIRKDGECPSCNTPLAISHENVEICLMVATRVSEEDVRAAREFRKKVEEERDKRLADNAEINARVSKLEAEAIDLDAKYRLAATDANDKIRALRASTSKIIDQINHQIATKREELSQAKATNAAIAKAKQELAEIEKSNRTVTEEEIARMTSAVTTAEQDLISFSAWHEASALAAEIAYLNKIREITGQNGMRAKNLNNAMQIVNVMISEACAAAGWPVMTLDEELNIISHPFQYRQLSTATKWRYNVVMQAVLAKMTNAILITVDEASMLAGDENRAGLINMLGEWCKVPAIIGMSANREYVESVSEYFDDAYWIEQGVSVRVP